MEELHFGVELGRDEVGAEGPIGLVEMELAAVDLDAGLGGDRVGHAEQDSDVVMFIFREEIYDEALLQRQERASPADFTSL